MFILDFDEQQFGCCTADSSDRVQKYRQDELGKNLFLLG